MMYKIFTASKNDKGKVEVVTTYTMYLDEYARTTGLEIIGQHEGQPVFEGLLGPRNEICKLDGEPIVVYYSELAHQELNP